MILPLKEGQNDKKSKHGSDWNRAHGQRARAQHRAANPEANLVAICDIRLEVAQAVADECGIQRVVKDYHDLLADKDIEAVLIATSTPTHAFIMKDVARAGKHIFCEKPLALDLEEIDEALAEVEKAGVKLQVGFNRRFDKSFQKVHEIVASGEIGRPCILHITNRDPEVPAMEFMRASGGMFLDMTIHDFDMARFQVGEVEEVYAIGSVLIEPELKELGDIDTNIVTLKFTNGAVGAIDNSRQAVYGYDQRLEVFCSNGTAMAENETENTTVKANPEGFHISPIRPLLHAALRPLLRGRGASVRGMRARRQAHPDQRTGWPRCGRARLCRRQVFTRKPAGKG